MFRRFIPLVVVVALFATACGSDSSGVAGRPDAGRPDAGPPETLTTTSTETTTTAPVDDGFPVTIAAPNGPVTIETMPERIVSISPTSTEVLFAVGAGDQVVAVDSLSDFPANAPVTDLVAFTPSIEAIATFDPDLVFFSFDPGGILSGLEALGIPVILHPAAISVDDAYAQWEQVGAATGRVAEAAAVVADTMTRIETAIASLPEGAGGMTYYLELDPTYFSATSSTFIGGSIALTGMQNIADAVDVDGFGFPQLTAEYIIDADPGMIFLSHANRSGVTSDMVAERPGWDSLSAVTNGSVVLLDDDIASRWGPRIADLLDDVVAAILERELANA